MTTVRSLFPVAFVLAVILSLRPAKAATIFSDIVVFTKVTQDLKGLDFGKFIDLLADHPNDFLKIYIVAEAATTAKPKFFLDATRVEEATGALPDIINSLPQVPVGTGPQTIQLTEPGTSILSDSLAMTIVQRKGAFVFISDLNTDPEKMIDKNVANKDELRDPDPKNPGVAWFTSVTGEMFPGVANPPYRVFILSDCGSPADVCSVPDTIEITPEPLNWLLLSTGVTCLSSYAWYRRKRIAKRSSPSR
jgi:hypothetical protein